MDRPCRICGCKGAPPLYGEWLPCSHPELCCVPGAVDVCRGSRASCPCPFSLRAPRACYPFLGLHRHDPYSARSVFWCPAPWTCAAAAGPMVFAPSTCRLSRMCTHSLPARRGVQGAKHHYTLSVPFLIEWFACLVPFPRLYWHDPCSARYAFGCPAPWTCAAAAGPTVLAPSACMLSRMCAGCQTGGAAMIPGRSRTHWRHPRARIFIFS